MYRFFCLMLVLVPAAISSCGSGSQGVNLTVQADVAPSGGNASSKAQASGGEADCGFSCDLTISESSTGKILFQRASAHQLPCFNGVLQPQSFTVFSGSLGSEIFSEQTTVALNCSQKSTGIFDFEGILAFIYLGEADLDADPDSEQTVQVTIRSLLEIILLGQSPEQAFELVNCPTLRFLETILTANCPTSGESPPPPEPLPGEGCGNGLLEAGEECDLDASTCSDLPIFECIPPGEEGECSCDLESCMALPLLQEEVLFNCTTSPECGDNICNPELGEPGNCPGDCHCGDSIFQQEMGEECEFRSGPACPTGEECGFPGLPQACQCVPIIQCGAGQFRCAAGSGVGCVVPCDGNEACPDGIDESFCGSCPAGTIQCPAEASCAVSCDANVECTQGDDENEAFCGPN